jgi:transposase-like protein
MAKSEEKLRIFELFRKNISVADVAKTSKTPERTLYRWYKEYQDSQESKKDTPVIGRVVKEARSQSESQLEIDFNEDWANVATKESIKHCICNGQIAKALSNILIKEIQQSDINYRAISALSASISIHSKLHRDYGMFYLLDINKAAKMLESEGYIILNPSEPVAT